MFERPTRQGKRLSHLITANEIAVALDSAEKKGLLDLIPTVADEPNCVVMRYATPGQMDTLTLRLPHFRVKIKSIGGPKKRGGVRIVRVFRKEVIAYILHSYNIEPTNHARLLNTIAPPEKYETTYDASLQKGIERFLTQNRYYRLVK